MNSTTGTTQHLSWDQVLTWRMSRHHLVERVEPASFLRVVGDICGLHAQLLSSAELSLWARTRGLERSAMQDAFWEQRSLVKLWAMRGTLHLLPADELGLWLAALGTYTGYGNSHPETDVLAEAVGQALAGQALTREELAVEVERITGSEEYAERVRFSWGSYLKPISFRGQLCFAESQNGLVRFTTPANWIQADITYLDPADALPEITRRFLSAYAPATETDLARWWLGGATPTRGRKMLEALDGEAVTVDLEGERVWVLARDLQEMASVRPANTVRLLPAFDPWVIGATRNSSAVLDPKYRERIYRRQGWVSPVLLVNGRMAGVWKYQKKGQRLIVSIEPFGRLPAWAGRQIEAETERLAEFLGGDLDLQQETGT